MALHWGIAGAGKISHDFVTALRTLPETEHVVGAVAARELSRARNFSTLHKIKKAFDSYTKLAEDKDIGTYRTFYFYAINSDDYKFFRVFNVVLRSSSRSIF